MNSGQPQNVYVLDTSKLTALNSMANQNGIVLDAQHRIATLPEGNGTIEFMGYKRYVGMEVRHDPGQNIVLYSFVVAFVGLIVSLFVARRRVWVRASTNEGVLTVEYGLLARGEDPRLPLRLSVLRMLSPPGGGWNLLRSPHPRSRLRKPRGSSPC